MKSVHLNGKKFSESWQMMKWNTKKLEIGSENKSWIEKIYIYIYTCNMYICVIYIHYTYIFKYILYIHIYICVYVFWKSL